MFFANILLIYARFVIIIFFVIFNLLVNCLFIYHKKILFFLKKKCWFIFFISSMKDKIMDLLIKHTRFNLCIFFICIIFQFNFS
jgi:hypothetical protein